jgi:hypothetical protein
MAGPQVIKYTPKLAIEFWFEFDNHFLPPGASPEVMAAYPQMGGINFFRVRFNEHPAAGTFPDGFRTEAIARAAPLLFLTNAQLEIIDRHFQGNAGFMQRAFEDFGQGVLFDERRQVGDKIHKMDIGPAIAPPVGYHRWHAIIRAAVFAGADEARCLQLDRLVGLAWACQSEAKPTEDDPNNPALPPEVLLPLRERWLQMDWDQLDQQFDSFPYPPVPPPPALSYEQDIRPLFREFDRNSMIFALDLWKYEDVRDRANDIFARVSQGIMPCDGPWPQEQIDRFKLWMDQGMQP